MLHLILKPQGQSSEQPNHPTLRRIFRLWTVLCLALTSLAIVSAMGDFLAAIILILAGLEVLLLAQLFERLWAATVITVLMGVVGILGLFVALSATSSMGGIDGIVARIYGLIGLVCFGVAAVQTLLFIRVRPFLK